MQAVDQRFAAQGEAGSHRAPEGGFGPDLHRRGRPRGAADHGGGDLGGGEEAGVGHGKQQLRLGVILHQQGKRAVVRSTRGGADALGHLLLNEDGETLKAAGLHAGGEKRRGDVVGQVGAQHGPQTGQVRSHQRGQLQLHHIALHQREVGIRGHGLGQHGVQAAVQLHGHHLAGAAGQLCGEGADAGANLHHAGVFIRAAGGGNVLRHPALDEKILPQSFGKAKAMPRQQGLYVVAVAQIHRGAPFFVLAVQYITKKAA